jgi:preprotein translocase subunit YajC
MDYSQLLFILVLVGAFYFIVIRPQQQRTKQQRAMQESLEPGDEVVSIGGIYATIVAIDERIRVRVADGSELEFSRQAIAQKLPARPDEDEDAEDDDEVETPEVKSEQP